MSHLKKTSISSNKVFTLKKECISCNKKAYFAKVQWKHLSHARDMTHTVAWHGTVFLSIIRKFLKISVILESKQQRNRAVYEDLQTESQGKDYPWNIWKLSEVSRGGKYKIGTSYMTAVAAAAMTISLPRFRTSIINIEKSLNARGLNMSLVWWYAWERCLTTLL